MLRCPEPGKARRIGCINIDEKNNCLRKVWNKVTYYKEHGFHGPVKREVFCELIQTTLREL